MRKTKILRVVAIFCIVNILTETLFPTISYALTGGPSQPEVQSFEPIGTSEMVDVFSGDFNYNIPLLDVGGYPVNLSYHSGITMDQESTWTGLGWNINPGVINRNMRSIPDDFDGDEIKKEFNIKDNHTFGVGAGFRPEIAGVNWLKFGFGAGVSYNNYKGVGFEISGNVSLSAGNKSKSSLTAGLGLTAGSEDGVGVSPSVSFEQGVGKSNKNALSLSASVGLPFNSREGLKALTIGIGAKNKDEGGKTLASTNSSASISFATPTYVPQIDMPMLNANLAFAVAFGTSFFSVDGMLDINGYYSGQYLADKEQKLPGYGYLFAHNGKRDGQILDFNREKDGGFNKNTPNLPLTNFSYDVYSVSGQGIGGMYRPFRSDIGIVNDSKVSNIGGGVSVGGIELGAGAGVHSGIDVSVNFSSTVSGPWTGGNTIGSSLKFKETSTDPFYEPYYFKQAGEKTAETDPAFLNNIGGYEAVRVGLLDAPQHATKNEFAGASLTTPVNSNNTRNSRQRRNETISFLNAEEAGKFGLEKEIKSYDGFSLNENGRYTPSESISRTIYPKHHISEISALRSDGARYIYGIPAYNNLQEEATFAVEGSANCATGLVSYSPGSDDSKSNDKGLDHYFNKTTLPKYAHSYLLTAILSSDYVDVTGDGPTDDDLGSYTKINYTRAVKDYKWRVPVGEAQANYSEGFKSKRDDDKASYIYGEKDIWYVHSIESRTHIAEFTLEDRADGYGVDGIDGRRGSDNMKKLRKITLYSKSNKVKNPVPIKTVHFEYDYSLCGSVNNPLPNNIRNRGDAQELRDAGNFINQGGKLTLKKIYFTYGNSNKGRLNSYIFNYADTNHDGVLDTNFEYNLKGYDRWGNFKENPASATCNFTSTLTTAEFPYTDQEKGITDQYAAAWSLTSIQLPSGGIIKVNYESDDYAYVQDKRAMQMFKVSGVGDNISTDPVNTNQLITSGNDNNNYIFFKLQKPIPSSQGEIKEFIRKQYIDDYASFNSQDTKLLYFKFLIDIDNKGKYEYVPGYVEIEDFGVNTFNAASQYNYGYIKVKEVAIGDNKDGNEKVNPISRTAWQFARLNLPRVAYGQPERSDTGVEQILKALASTIGSIVELFQGFNRKLRSQDFGKKFIAPKSWIRLHNPSGNKLGGGARVNKIALSDGWDQMTGNSKAEYGQIYDYTTTNEYNETISSGVAAYEPVLGGDENPFKQPVFYELDKLMAPDDEHYMEGPFGESFFPSPSVGYSKVTVRNLPHAGVAKNATGSVVHEFYTAKDFPTITNQTTVDAKREKPNPLLKLLKLKVKDYMTASQGYSIELNDMHGKQKAQWVYPEGSDKYISGVEYFYKQKKGNKLFRLLDREKNLSAKELDNDVDVIEKSGIISKKTVGVDFDFIVDMRQHESKTISGGVNANLDVFVVGIIPVAIPMILPSFANEQVRFRSAVTTKVIQRYALLEETVAYDVGSKVATKNLLYDAHTGEVLLTETTNQFNDPIYAMNYPAHWGYDGMGQAFINIGLKFKNVELNSIANAKAYFVPGDEIALDDKLAWVTSVSDGGIEAMYRDATLASGTFTSLKILRSGRRNQQTTSIGSVTTLKNPIASSGQLAFDKVLNSGAVEFKNKWSIFCNCGLDPSKPTNPYITGAAGNWRAVKSYLYLTDRTQSKLNDNTSLRKDGIFKSYDPFWLPSFGNNIDWTANAAKWTWTTEVVNFSPYGFELENKDALNRFSAALYGYNNIIPTAVANNSKYKEVAFDGFEDYDFGNCEDDHFSFKKDKTKRVQAESHTGRNSIKVPAGQSVKVRKVIEKCD